jgi:pyruvate,water dikinase
LDDLQPYLDTYGHQIYNLDFAAPTLVDDPLPVLLSLKMAVAHPERDARAHQAALEEEREGLVARTERALNPIQRPIFRRLWRWAQRYSPYREEALFYVGAAWPALRRLALELGRRLAQAGSLDTPDDVFYLESAELAEASLARAEGTGRPDLAKLARERRTLREARKRLEPPVSVPPDGRMKFGPIDMSMFEPKPRTVSTGPTLEGFAVSPGQVTARASIVHSPEEFDKMVPDSILVCTTTTPAWTPLFARAKGLVTDIGGALAHGSIVAREYGIPAVMGTGNATQRIENGEQIRVDGDRGTVTLVDRVAPGDEEGIRAQ